MHSTSLTPMDTAPQVSRTSAYRKAGYSIAAYLCSWDVRTPPWRDVVALAGSEAARRARLELRTRPRRSRRRRASAPVRIAAEGLVVDNWNAIDALAQELLSRQESYLPAVIAEFLVKRFHPAV